MAASACGARGAEPEPAIDLLAHALWAGAGVAAARRRWPLGARAGVAAVTLAVLPDLVQGVPVAGWALFGNGSLLELRQFAHALPGQEPALPALVAAWSHHLHCIGHSAVIAALVSFFLLPWWRIVAAGLAGWWSHIAIDVFTHSADFYPVPVLYPLTMRGFDGIAWHTPWFQALNYGALAAIGAWLWWTRGRTRPG